MRRHVSSNGCVDGRPIALAQVERNTEAERAILCVLGEAIELKENLRGERVRFAVELVAYLGSKRLLAVLDDRVYISLPRKNCMRGSWNFKKVCLTRRTALST